MNLTQIRHALEEARVKPVKTLGQNFLHDQNLARWVVSQAEITEQDFVVEIGPGLGALTAEILARGARVLALEKDGRLVSALREKFSGTQIEIRHVDALDFDLRELFPERSVKVLGNLPYYVASQLLLKSADFPFCNKLMVFMLQDEMAKRICAAPGSPDFGALSVRLQFQFHVAYLRRIPATVFYPQPEVDSAIVRLRPRDERTLGIRDLARARTLVRLGFSQRRKQLRKLLREELPAWDEAAAAIGCSGTARAEELSPEKWIALANLGGPATHPVAPEEIFPVVDEHDRETGVATRREVHENNLRHRAVHILLFNQAGEVLLQKRSATKDRHPLVWDSSAAGHVDAGETYAETAARELREELGVEAVLQLLDKLPASDKTGQEFIEVYLGRHNGPFVFATDEISAVEFFPPPLVERWIENKPEDFAPGFLECWKLWGRLTQAD